MDPLKDVFGISLCGLESVACTLQIEFIHMEIGLNGLCLDAHVADLFDFWEGIPFWIISHRVRRLRFAVPNFELLEQDRLTW